MPSSSSSCSRRASIPPVRRSHGCPGRVRFLAFLALLYCLVAGHALARCGKERWAIKTGTDSEAAGIHLNHPVPTDILTLTTFPAPAPIPSDQRVEPLETTVWILDATLTDYVFESDPQKGDSDYHLVLRDPDGHTMIAEIPSPDCVDSASPFRAAIEQARAAFDARFTATRDFQTTNTHVRVTGVGMFDFSHGQRGYATNGIELHPVLAIEFAPATPLPSTPSGSQEVVVNGGFEAGLSGWTRGGVRNPTRSSSRAASGTHSMRCGAVSSSSSAPEPDGDSWIYQSVSIPAGSGNAELRFRYSTASSDELAYDWQEMQVRDADGNVLLPVFRICSDRSEWRTAVADLTAYRGSTVQLWFNCHGDGYTDPTSLWVDDVSLKVQP